MKRYYLCRVVGTGAQEDPIRPRVADFGVNFSAALAEGRSWSLCLVAATIAKHLQLQADPDVWALPNLALDGPLSGVTKAIRDALSARLTALGIDLGALSPTDTLRSVVRRLGALHEPLFSEDIFDVSE